MKTEIKFRMSAWILITVFVFLMCLVSCRSAKVESETTTSSVTDSTIIKENERWMVVEIPGEVMIIDNMIECDSITNKPKPFKKKATKLAKPRPDGSLDPHQSGSMAATTTLDSTGKLTTECECLDQKRKVRALDREVTRLRTEKENKNTTKVKEVERPVRWYDKACRTFTGLVIVAIAFYSIGKYYSIGK